LSFLIMLVPYQLIHIFSGKSAVKRIQQTNIRANAASKLLDVIRLPFKSLPQSFHLFASVFRD
jgi:hypothetical protein